jgi:DNA-binding NarL/FixJ family response regulator
MSIRLLLCDEHQVCRKGLRVALEEEPDLEVVGEAADGAQALRRARALHPDIVVTEVRLPGLDGVTTIRGFARLPRPPRVLVLTACEEESVLTATLRAGVGGFLLKSDPVVVIVEAIRQVASDDTPLSPRMTRKLLNRPTGRLNAFPAGPPDKIGNLTSREREVLHELTKGFSNAEIARALGVGEATVKAHVSRLLYKLELRDRIETVIFAYETGFVQPSAQHPVLERGSR